MTQHTPLGPLHVGGYLDEGAPIPVTYGTVDDPGDVVADVDNTFPEHAKLFAAAPELLETLDNLLEEIEIFASTLPVPVTDRLAGAVRDAIGIVRRINES